MAASSDHRQALPASDVGAVPPRPSVRRRLWMRSPGLGVGWLRDFVFGYDLFIAYDFDEAGKFAETLKARLEGSKRPLRCFLDREGFIIGDKLYAATRGISLS